MSRWVCILFALLCLPLRFTAADDVARSGAAVYKIGVNLRNGRAGIGSAVLVASGKLITSCHTIRDASQIFVLHRDGQLAVTATKMDMPHDLCMLSVPSLRARACSTASLASCGHVGLCSLLQPAASGRAGPPGGPPTCGPGGGSMPPRASASPAGDVAWPKHDT